MKNIINYKENIKGEITLINKKLIFIILIIIVILIGIIVFFITKTNRNYNGENQGNIKENNIIQNNTNIANYENNKENKNIINQGTLENNSNNTERKDNMKIYITVNNKTLTATLNDNSSSKALIEKLKNGSVTINTEDYAKMEKVGSLGFSLPRNDESINTEAGDLILYQGNSFVIYYDNNNWSLTRLGKIDNITQKELKEILGTGSVKVTLSIEK